VIEGATGRTLTWSDLAATAAGWRRARHALDHHGRARVGLLVLDPLTCVRSYLAALAAGVTIAPLDPGATAPELADRVTALGLTALVVDHPPTVPTDGLAVWMAAGAEPTLVAAGMAARPEPKPTQAALIMASSGTTGPPKIVPLTEGNLLHTAACVAGHHGLGAGDRGYSPLPLFHINALVVGVLSAVVSGASLVVDRRFSRSAFWGTVDRHGVTWLNLVPAVVSLLAGAEAPPPAVPARVRFARSASSPLAPSTLAAFERACGIPVVETYGMTEAGSQITANPLTGSRPGSVGRPVGLDLQVVDQHGRVVPAGAVGAVEIRGASVVTHYWSPAGTQPAAKPATTPEGWLPTGDLGVLDGDGWLHLVGRADDVINRGGEKIHPREVEEVLLADRRVGGAVVVGRPHTLLGHEPVAYVTVAPDHVDDGTLVDDLGRRCAAVLSRYKRPARILVAETLPAGPTGKIRRAEVRRLAADPDDAAGAALPA
jgi:acyl-CoA synthetase (AMP-forming)/AMP-acid ligase II